jgi:hypothetical protein
MYEACQEKVLIAHTGRADGVRGVRLRGDVSGAEKFTSDTLSVLILCKFVILS